MNSWGVRIASVVKSTTTAMVKFAESKTSTAHQPAPGPPARGSRHRATGSISPRRDPPPGPGFARGSACWEASSSSATLRRAAGFPAGAKKQSGRAAAPKADRLDSGRRRSQPHSIRAARALKRDSDESEVQCLVTCGRTIPPIDPCVHSECEDPHHRAESSVLDHLHLLLASHGTPIEDHRIHAAEARGSVGATHLAPLFCGGFESVPEAINRTQPVRAAVRSPNPAHGPQPLPTST